MTKHGLAGWRTVTRPGEICVVMDGPSSMPPSLTECTTCPDLVLLSCELLANTAAVADVLVLNVYKTLS